MLKFYFNPTPNPMKVALFLEEAAIPFEAVPIDVRLGQQFAPEFLALNPNGKVPVIVDGGHAVFDSTAILLYLADKTGKFLPPNNTWAARGEMLSWLEFVGTGVGPFAGQAVHFRHYAPEKVPYAEQRYFFEAERHFRILDDRLKNRRHMVSYAYTIVDMAVWAWSRNVERVLGEGAWEKFPYLKRHCDEIEKRPAAQRALALKDGFTFVTETDDEARRHMFRHLGRENAGV
ncbi:Glutathione S-transferase domain protein [Rhodomicrobium vannielii ATCC 17100]|uniref:Glutathione S-transferase domain protein n=1 Tax=Rhodomicrobium vannielii (strain ATCC 17100 / DSM 162 / LMG 4299 / NCIMB 10020 / ATH 3.1.1) TaxID=648757 RepID=E3I7T8_RHOVT|nr:glutathione S-transferase N-terminal domain-containing protein [Rhodomicrobium vannielii]ADP70792.1 Glutathione S-transferase domain protein [Rhodomicrobium vannielii ATCC 17100]